MRSLWCPPYLTLSATQTSLLIHEYTRPALACLRDFASAAVFAKNKFPLEICVAPSPLPQGLEWKGSAFSPVRFLWQARLPCLPQAHTLYLPFCVLEFFALCIFLMYHVYFVSVLPRECKLHVEIFVSFNKTSVSRIKQWMTVWLRKSGSSDSIGVLEQKACNREVHCQNDFTFFFFLTALDKGSLSVLLVLCFEKQKSSFWMRQQPPLILRLIPWYRPRSGKSSLTVPSWRLLIDCTLSLIQTGTLYLFFRNKTYLSLSTELATEYTKRTNCHS